MLKAMRCDLHIHTCLHHALSWTCTPGHSAPGPEKKLTSSASATTMPRRMPLRSARRRRTAACGIAGMEVASREEVHTLALFENIIRLRHFQELVYGHLRGKTMRKSSAARPS